MDALPPAEEGAALYVHLPFCEAKCHYCDFFSVPAEGQDIDGTLDAILAEAERRAPRRPRTVFLGGGTPSLLDAAQLRRLLDRLDELTGFRESAVEVTAECNPESLDRSKAEALLELGVRRLSIGFQSLSAATLELFGRVHDAEASFRAFEAAREAGVEDLNVDLIYATPGQTPEEWESELGRVLELAPDHLSAYNLTFEEDTRFRRWLETGRLSKAPEEVELACFEITRKMASAAGFGAYEVSNYARSGRECLHNIGYWENRPYVGIGPGAVSGVPPHRGGNVKAIAPYRARMAGAGHATQWRETRTALQRLGETWWLGLRLLRGVDPEEARSRAGFKGPEDPCSEAAARLSGYGLVEEVEGRFRQTPRGMPLADGVAARILEAADPSEQ